MEIKLVIVGAILVILGIFRHFSGKSMPKIGFQLVSLPGIVIAGPGILLVIAGALL
jgi:hypothetical protein